MTVDHLGKDYEASILRVVKDANARGEFFTPFELSRLMAELVGEVASVHDPACGSGSLLLTVNAKRKHGQELNPATAEMARSNLPDAEIITGNTLYLDAPKRCEAVVSNPPYSTPYDLSQIDPFDLRYQGKPLAPKTKSDLMFVLHGIEVMERIGVFVMFPGVLYRTGAEAKIRAYLVGHNLIDSVIQLPEKLFLRTSIATCLLILRKDREAGAPILFVDASDEFRAEGKINVLEWERILEVVRSRKVVDRFSALGLPDDDVLAVRGFVDTSPEKKEMNIHAVNAVTKLLHASTKRGLDLWDDMIDGLEYGGKSMAVVKSDVQKWKAERAILNERSEKLGNGDAVKASSIKSEDRALMKIQREYYLNQLMTFAEENDVRLNKDHVSGLNDVIDHLSVKKKTIMMGKSGFLCNQRFVVLSPKNQ